MSIVVSDVTDTRGVQAPTPRDDVPVLNQSVVSLRQSGVMTVTATHMKSVMKHTQRSGLIPLHITLRSKRSPLSRDSKSLSSKSLAGIGNRRTARLIP